MKKLLILEKIRKKQLLQSNMRIQRKGNLKGLDIDYQVDMIEYPHEVESFHQDLLKKGLLFMYATGSVPYETPTSNTVLHYIDQHLKLYDYSILFSAQAKRPAKDYISSTDKNYELAKTDPELKQRLMTYMKYKKWLYAFRNHIKAYGTIDPEYKTPLLKIFEKLSKDTVGIEVPTTYTEQSLLQLDKTIKQFFAL
jgi:hypothetical protein